MASYSITSLCGLLTLAALLSFTDSQSANAAGTAKHDPCGLLTQMEVEAVMGALAVPPYLTGSGVLPRPNGDSCRYEAPDRHSIRVNVTWDGGRDLIAMMGSMQAMVNTAGLAELKLLDGSTVSGHWDQARVSQCCTFNALRDDQVVTVDISGSHATLAQAASLADAAIQRLAQPLPISGAAGVKAALERAAQRPKPRNVCELLPAADVEAIVGTALAQPPKGTNDSCRYIWPAGPAGSTYQLDLAVTWQDGFSEMRLTNAAVGNASAMLGFGKPRAPTSGGGNSDPWDEVSQSIIGVSAVKDDVRVSIEGGPMQQDIQRAFIRKAVANLSK